MAHPGGRPPIYNNVEDFDKKINEYFEWVDGINEKAKATNDKLKPYTISGLCVYMGISKETFYDYAKKPEYIDSYKSARSRVENCVEEGSMNGKWNTIGAIFNLKNNFGWVDRKEVVSSNEPTKIDVNELLEEDE